MEFKEFLGISLVENKEFQQQINSYKRKQLKNIVFYTNQEKGFCLECCFPSEKLQCIHLYGPAFTHFNTFLGLLPHRLTWHSMAKDLVSCFGEPERKEGGNGLEIRLGYDRLGFECTLGTKIWNDPSARLISLAIYKPEGDLLCAMCRKDNPKIDCNCKLVYYCSEKCKNFFQDLHKTYCSI